MTDALRADGGRPTTDYERRLLARADQLDSLVTEFLTELRVHTDLLRSEIENQETPDA